MTDLIDKKAEMERLSKEIEKAEQEQTRLKNKLTNENFVKRAPAAVVEKEQEKLQLNEQLISKLSDQLAKVENI